MTALGQSAYVPPAGDAWERVDPGDAGWDLAKLEEAVTFAGERNSTALLVVQGGRIVVERYWQGWNEHSAALIASCQKSFSAVLAGIAQHEGLLRLDHLVAQHLGSGWSHAGEAEELRITLRHLLTMTSGLDEGLQRGGEPGSVWFYNTPAYYRLKGAIQAAAGVPFEEYFRSRLAEPLGLQDSAWQGEMFAPPPGQQLHASGRDMARFGLLVLRGGRWNGRTIIPDAAYHAAMLESSQDLNPAYGYLWWLNGKDRWQRPARGVHGQGTFIPSAPADMVAALGAADKKIHVVPSLDLVVVRHGGAAFEAAQAVSTFDEQLWQRLSAARLGTA
jgi:CubicO group peptidase (beta-lactamase class C family)